MRTLYLAFATFNFALTMTCSPWPVLSALVALASFAIAVAADEELRRYQQG